MSDDLSALAEKPVEVRCEVPDNDFDHHHPSHPISPRNTIESASKASICSGPTAATTFPVPSGFITSRYHCA